MTPLNDAFTGLANHHGTVHIWITASAKFQKRFEQEQFTF